MKINLWSLGSMKKRIVSYFLIFIFSWLKRYIPTTCPSKPSKPRISNTFYVKFCLGPWKAIGILFHIFLVCICNGMEFVWDYLGSVVDSLDNERCEVGCESTIRTVEVSALLCAFVCMWIYFVLVVVWLWIENKCEFKKISSELWASIDLLDFLLFLCDSIFIWQIFLF